MRQIKFRAWDTVEKCMWYNQFAISSYGRFHRFEPAREYFCHHSNNNIILLQFTGIFDLHGTKIFEGDILDCICTSGDCQIIPEDGWKQPVPVFFDLEDASYKFRDKRGWELSIVTKHYKVIGNAYENEELLNE